MKKALIITYYWPPMGGGGVQRWLKFCRYMRKYNWEPIIFTPSNAELSNPDSSLESQIPEGIEEIRVPIWEPFNAYKKFTGKSTEQKVQPGFLQEGSSRQVMEKLSVWIRGNLFIPDAKMFWIKPSVTFLTDYLKSKPVDIIISTGPPHTNHLIALKLKRKLGVKWLADFRDPWTNIDYYNKLKLTTWADKKHHKMESEVLTTADEVTTVSWDWADDFYKRTGRKPVVVTNGYDPEDFKNSLSVHLPKDKLVFTHVGSLNEDRNPHVFWNAISELTTEGKIDFSRIHVKLIGPTDYSVFRDLERLGLNEIVEHISHIPHKEVIDQLLTSSVQLLPLNDTPNIGGVIPGKLYEYLASRRYILCVGKTGGDAARIINESDSGWTINFNDLEKMKIKLMELYNAFLTGSISYTKTIPEKYSRKKLTERICNLLDQITNQPLHQ